MSPAERENTTQRIRSLQEAILDQARTEAEDRLARAQGSAEESDEQTKKDAQGLREQITGEAQKDASGEKRRVVSAAQLQAHYERLQKREEIISRAFDEAAKRLEELRKSDDYKGVLAGLIREGAAALGGGELIVGANEEDFHLLTKKFLSDVVEQMEPKTKLARAEGSLQANGGVVLSKADGSTRYDNTFDARLQRFQTALRNQVYRILTGES